MEFMLFLLMLASVSLNAPASFYIVFFLFHLTLKFKGRDTLKRRLRSQTSTFGRYFYLLQIHDFFVIQSLTLFLLGWNSQNTNFPIEPLQYLFFASLLVVGQIFSELSFYFHLKSLRQMRLHYVARMLLITLIGVMAHIKIWELGLIFTVICLPEVMIVSMSWVKRNGKRYSNYVYSVRYASFLLLLGCSYGYVHVKALLLPHNEIAAYVAIALKDNSLMKKFIDGGGNIKMVFVKFKGEKFELAPLLIHRNMHASIEHLRLRQIDFSSQEDEYLKSFGQDLLIPIAMKDDLKALELVEHLPLRYDIRYPISHSNILHFVSRHCSPKVANALLPRIKREMLYEANQKGVTPLTSAAENKCQSVLDVYGKLSPNWHHTDRKGRSVAGIQKTASVITQGL